MNYLNLLNELKNKTKDDVINFFNDNKNILLSSDKRLSNVMLNEYEIATDATILKSKPRVLKVTLTNMCNLKCIMCFCHRLPEWKLPQKYKNQIIEMLPFLERVSWVGGEVFLYDYFKELIYNANKYNVQQDIITNGTLIDDCMAKYLVQNNVDIEFSIDSLKPDVYKKIRINGELKDALRGLDKCYNAKIRYGSKSKITLNVVISQFNYNEIEDFILLANKYNFFYLRIATDGKFYLPNSQEYFVGGKEILNIAPILNDLYNNEDYIMEVATKKNVMLIYDLPRRMNNKGEVKNLIGKNINGQKNCRVPWTSLYIDFDGAIKGHCCCTEKIAEKDSDLLEIWNGNIMQEYRNEMKNGGFSHYCGNQCTKYGFFDAYL